MAVAVVVVVAEVVVVVVTLVVIAFSWDDPLLVNREFDFPVY